jgi:hypothetical protein
MKKPMMKHPFIVALGLMIVGCGTTPQQGEALTAAQAQAMALKLANLEAQAVYQHQPFSDGQPARLEQGRWVWIARQGYGQGDIEATVELALDGSTNNVQLERIHNQQNQPEF